MNSREFNGKFRPLVAQAWHQQCRLTGLPPNTKAAKDRWYREQLNACCQIRTTKDASDPQQRQLIDWFKSVIGPDMQDIRIDGWSDGQNNWFQTLLADAWVMVATDQQFEAWLDMILENCGIYKRQAPDKVDSFDQVMGTLAVIANDTRAISHFASAAEKRMRWQIRRYLSDLEWLEKQQIDTSYVAAIWKKAQLMPKDIEDAPAETLRLVLAMIDTHIRRLCKAHDIRPMHLPSRDHPEECHRVDGSQHVGHAADDLPF